MTGFQRIKAFKISLVLASYFGLCLVAFALVYLFNIFWPLFFIIPLVYIGKIFAPLLKPLGLWKDPGASGWLNYVGPDFYGFLLIAVILLVVSVLIELYFAKKSTPEP